MNDKMTTCKHCGAQIAKAAKICPQCGGKNKKPLFLRPWFIILAVIIVLAVLGGVGGKNSGHKKVATLEQSQTNSYAALISEPPSSNNEMNSSQQEEVSDVPAQKEAYQVGDIIEDGNVRIVYVSSGVYHTDNEFLLPKDGNHYIYLEFAFINEGKTDTTISFYNFEAYADGYNVEMFYGADEDLSASLSSGRSTTGKVYFEVPDDAENIEIEYTPFSLKRDKIVFLYEGELDSGYVPEVNSDRTEAALAVGDVFEGKDIKITYLSCEPYESDNMFVQPKEGYQFISILLEFENLGNSDRTISSFSFNCYADGAACETTYIRDDNLSATISAGRKAKGSVTFEIPESAEIIEAEFNNNIWTSEKVVFTIR